MNIQHSGYRHMPTSTPRLVFAHHCHTLQQKKKIQMGFQHKRFRFSKVYTTVLWFRHVSCDLNQTHSSNSTDFFRLVYFDFSLSIRFHSLFFIYFMYTMLYIDTLFPISLAKWKKYQMQVQLSGQKTKCDRFL